VRRLIRREGVTVVFSSGGYIAAPPILAARWCGVPVVLGSATPALETQRQALSRRLTRLVLPARARAGARAPSVRVLDVRKRKLEAGLAPELLDALRNMVGMFDTPVVRRHYNSDFHREACESARCAIAKAEGRS
jgi:hypothetical protein